jgi:hypothetical protein
MVTTVVYVFLIDMLLALATLVGTTALLWAWFRWLAGRAMRADGTGFAPHARRLPVIGSGAWSNPDLAPPSASPAARAEIAELEALWKLSPGSRSDQP